MLGTARRNIVIFVCFIAYCILLVLDFGGIMQEESMGDAGLQAALGRWAEWPSTFLIPGKNIYIYIYIY